MKRFLDTAERIKQDQAISQLKNVKDGTVVPIPLKLVLRNENIRHDHTSDSDPDFDSLKSSINEVGLLQHPIVTVSGGQIICIAGHRRFAACEALNMEKVSCVIRHFDSLTTKQMVQLCENTARRNLHPLDIGLQLLKLKESGVNQIKLQEIMKKDRKTIGRFQKMAIWPEQAKKIIFDHPDKLKTGVLLQLASRDLSDRDLIVALKDKAGLIKASPTLGTKPTKENLLAQTQAYFSRKKIGKRDQSMLLKMLVDLGLLADVKSGNKHRTSALSTAAKN